MKLGSVPYLNAAPLIAGISDPVQTQTPRELLGALRAGDVDIALLSTVSLLEYPDLYLLPGMGIGCKGPIRSVKLFFNKSNIDKCNLKGFNRSPESNTANILAQLLLSGVGHLEREVSDTCGCRCPTPAEGSGGHAEDAELVIGDMALTRPDPYGSKDLGQWWWEKTGLPFVFAAWISRHKTIPRKIWESLMAAKLRNLREIDACIAQSPLLPELSPTAKRDYLLNNIHYDLGETEMAGLAHFREDCITQAILPHALPIQLVEFL